MKPAIRQGLYVIMDQGFLSLTTFITGVLVARATSKEEYGAYVLGWSIVMIFQSIQSALVGSPTTILLPRTPESSKKEYLASSVVFILLTSVIAMLLLSSAYLIVRTNGNSSDLVHFLPAIAVAVTPLTIRMSMRTLFLARLEVTRSIAGSMIATTLQLCGIFAIFSLHTLTAFSAFLIIGSANLVAAVSMIYLLRNSLRLSTKRLPDDFRRNWRVGRWMVLNVAGLACSSHAYPWLLLILLGSGSVAVFGACLAIASLLNPLLNGLSAFILPKMAHGFKDGNKETLNRMLRQSIMAIAAIYCTWLCVGFFSRNLLVSGFYGEEYSGYGWLLVLLLLKTTIESTASPLSSALQALEKPQSITLALLLSSMITLLVGFILIRQFGLTGAAISAILAATVSGGSRYLSIRRASRINLKG